MELELDDNSFIRLNKKTNEVIYYIQNIDGNSYIDFKNNIRLRLGIEISTDKKISIPGVPVSWSYIAVFIRKNDKIKHIALDLKELEDKLFI